MTAASSTYLLLLFVGCTRGLKRSQGITGVIVENTHIQLSAACGKILYLRLTG